FGLSSQLRKELSRTLLPASFTSPPAICWLATIDSNIPNSTVCVAHASTPGKLTIRKPCPALPDFAVTWCPKDWVGFEGNCYFFSDDEGSWDSSQNSCSSLRASLAAIESEEEKAFMLRYKGKSDHWIGLRREQKPDQPWKWTNGSEFNNWFPIRGGGDCPYLSDDGVSSSKCYVGRHWICSKPDAFTKRKGHAMERHSQVQGNN
uniref:C-type lectin domain-containing protein n=1 Tax=Terrapene triunguis TaxID=2587831 RepID=A0A674IQS9_9SAUR